MPSPAEPNTAAEAGSKGQFIPRACRSPSRGGGGRVRSLADTSIAPQGPRPDDLAPPAARESARAGLARSLGLHPLVAFGMFACDWMMFGGEAGSVGIGLAITIPIALALSIPSMLVQRYSYGDPWGAAIGKGLLVGVLTAIPMPIGSPVTLAGGVLGLLRPKKKALPP